MLIGETTIERCAPNAAALRELVRLRRPRWLLIGQGLDEGTAAALAAAARAVQPALRLGLLGAPDDVHAFNRWACRGCSLYLVEPPGTQCVAYAFSGAATYDLALTDRLFCTDRAQQPAGGPQQPITRRERDVLELVVTGRRNREIAAALHLSENTVETHLRNLFSKLQVSTRAEAVERAIRSGVI
jgi:DNA-binding NarL/FixJ family response regulator